MSTKEQITEAFKIAHIACIPHFDGDDFGSLKDAILKIIEARDEYALLLFQPCGETHHDANSCPYCKENLNGKS